LRKSHIVFGCFCIVWVTVLVLINNELIKQEGLYPTIGKSIGSLLIPGLGYGLYLFIQGKRSKTTISKN